MSDKLILSLETGDVTIETFPDKAPGHVARIKELAEEGFYDGLTAHRVIDGFMAQMGCPRGDGTGGSGQNIDAEFNDVSHQRGVCSMARAQNPNSADSQFFICFDDASFLDGQYTAWGKVVDGMEHVDAVTKGEPPKTPTKIVSFRVAA
jgi:peptidylprolyl isomerase